MDFGKILDWIKLSPRYLLPISLTSGFLLFSPYNWLEVLALNSLLQSYRSWIGLIFLVSAALLISHVVLNLSDFIRSKISGRLFLKTVRQTLRNLTPSEKEVLRKYIEGDTKSQRFRIDDGVVRGLEAKGIIYQASSLGDLITGFPYNLQPWVFNFLKQNLNLLNDD